MNSRRRFLKGSASLLAAAAGVPLFLRRASALAAESGKRGKVLVVLFLRGAVDSLNVLIPFREPFYKKARPGIALLEPAAKEGRPLDLDGSFALHPALRVLLPLYRKGHLSFVRGVGLPQVHRSHFDAQDFMETGTPGLKSTQDGWLARGLKQSPAGNIHPQAVALSRNLPRILRGAEGAVAFPQPESFDFRGQRARDRAAPAFHQMYQGSEDLLLGPAAAELFDSLEAVRAMEPDDTGERGNIKYGNPLKDAARLVKELPGLRVVFAEAGGWDHHSGETARMNQGLSRLGPALASFAAELGDRMEDVVLVTLTEFGRTVRENGSGGTDHGYGGFSMVLGGPVKGGKLYGEFKGLDPELLFEGRDLPVTVDFRQVLHEVLVSHLGIKDTSAVFPGFVPAPKLGIL